jgi:hypothetical protein
MASALTVRLTANFERDLETIRAFLDEHDPATAFAALLDDLFERIIPNLERFPDIGVDFLARVPRLRRRPVQDRPTAPRRPKISFSQGGEWNALINRYMGTIPLSGAPDPDEQSLSIGLPPRSPVSKARIAKVGVAARHSHSAGPSAAVAPSSLRLALPVE